MKVSQNSNFQRHREQIENQLSSMEGDVAKSGRTLFNEMLSAAESLDLLFSANSDVMPSQQIITLRRDEFHKRCRAMGEWLTEHAPELRLEWI